MYKAAVKTLYAFGSQKEKEHTPSCCCCCLGAEDENCIFSMVYTAVMVVI